MSNRRKVKNARARTPEPAIDRLGAGGLVALDILDAAVKGDSDRGMALIGRNQDNGEAVTAALAMVAAALARAAASAGSDVGLVIDEYRAGFLMRLTGEPVGSGGG